MLLGVIEEAGGLESGASCFSATLETVALTSESVGKEQDAAVHFPALTDRLAAASERERTDKNRHSGGFGARPVLSRHSRCFFQCPLISRTRAWLSGAELWSCCSLPSRVCEASSTGAGSVQRHTHVCEEKTTFSTPAFFKKESKIAVLLRAEPVKN